MTSAARRAPGGSRRGGAWRERRTDGRTDGRSVGRSAGRRIYVLGEGPGRAAEAVEAGGADSSIMVSGGRGSVWGSGGGTGRRRRRW